MSSPTYQWMGFIEDNSDFDFAVASGRFAERFGRMNGTATLVGKTITVSINNWRLKVSLNDRDYVLDESKDIANTFLECSKAKEISQCRRRVELWSEDDDWELEHINEFILAGEIVSEFKGVILFDLQSGELV